ncbi:hypothetical protein SLE2022_317440 [Rubroshorea leprosula]
MKKLQGQCAEGVVFLRMSGSIQSRDCLFSHCPNDHKRSFPNHASKVYQLHLDYFRFAGRVIALALMHKVQVGVVFDPIFFLQLAGMHVSSEDIKEVDPCLYSSYKQILAMDADAIDSDDLGLTFVREVKELGSKKVIELCVLVGKALR